VLALEWPLPWLKDTSFHRAFAVRFVAFPIMSLAALLQYQCTNAAFYLLIGSAYVRRGMTLIVGFIFRLGRKGKGLEGLCQMGRVSRACRGLMKGEGRGVCGVGHVDRWTEMVLAMERGYVGRQVIPHIEDASSS